MAGERTIFRSGADFLSAPLRYRFTFDTDGAPEDILEEIHLTNTPTANDNRVLLVPDRLSGVGLIKYKFWGRFPAAHAEVRDIWFLLHETDFVDSPVLLRVFDLKAAIYRIGVEHSDGDASSFVTYASTNIPDAFTVAGVPSEFEDWGFINSPPGSAEDWGSVADPFTQTFDWGFLLD